MSAEAKRAILPSYSAVYCQLVGLSNTKYHIFEGKMRGMGGIVVTAASPLSAIVLVMLSLRDFEDAHTLCVPYT